MMTEKNSNRRSQAVSFPSWKLLAALPLTAFAGMGNMAQGGIEGAQTIAGNVTIQQQGAVTNITASHNSIIQYQKFGIASNETVNFIQPSSTSRVLNRVEAITATHINGSLNANGIVYIVNPAGVYFGNGALVDVGGIYAGAGNISNADFISGINRFTDLQGEVVNYGQIQADGTAAFIGKRVENHGSILSTDGLLIMATGEEIILQPRGSHIHVKFPKGGDEVAGDGEATLVNNGTLDAGEGRVLLGSSDMFGLAIHQTATGSIKADEVMIAAEDGRVEVSGSIDAGEIAQVTGEELVLTGAELSAGQTLNVGGEYLGGGTLATATTTFVDSASTLEVGAGGTLTIWSDDVTGFYGSIIAPQSFVEVSGKNLLLADLSGVIDSGASTLLLDPTNVEIGDFGGAANSSDGNFVGGTWIPADTTAPASLPIVSQVDVADVVALLNAGTSVNITTNVTNTPDEAGNISLTADLLPNLGGGAATFELNAQGSITISNVITANAGGAALAVDFNAGAGVAVNAAITTNGGTFNSNGTTFVSTALINTGAATTTIQHTDTVSLGAITAATLNATSGGAMTNTGALTVSGTGTFIDTSGTSITLNNAGNNFGTVVSNAGAGGTITIVDSNAVILGSTTATTLNVTAGGAISDSGTLAVSGVSTLDDTTDTSIILDDAANNFGTVAADSGIVTLVDVDGIILGATTATTLNVTAGGAISDSGTLAVSGVSTLDDTSDTSIILDDAANNFGTVATDSGTVTLVDTDGIILGATTATTLNATAGGAISDSGTLAVSGVSTLDDTSDTSIILDDAANNFGTVAADSGIVTLVDVDGIILGATTATTLNVTAGGAISDSGTLAVSGVSTLDDTTDTSIILDDAANNFGTVAADSGIVTLVDVDGIILGATTATTLNVTAGGAISDSGTLAISGVSTLDDTSDTSIILDDAANNFGTVAADSGIVTLVDTDGIILGATTATTLNATAGGAISDSGTLAVSGVSTLDDTSDTSIILDDAANNFGTVAADSGIVTLVDVDGIILGATTATTLNVTAGGAISDSGTLAVSGVSTLDDTTDTSIILDDAANNFGTVAADSGIVTLVDVDGIILGATTATTLNVTAGGAISDSGTLAVSGVSTLDDTSDTSIILDDAANNFGTVAADSGTVTLVDTDGIILGATTATTLNVTAGGAISDSGTLAVSGVSTLDDTTDTSIILDDAANNFGTVAADSGTVTLVDVDGIILGATTATTLNVTAGGAISDSGTLAISGVSTLDDTSDTSIILDDAANNFGTVAADSGIVTLVDVDGIILGATTATTLNVTAGGAISDSGTLAISGVSTLDDTSDTSIILDDAANNFGTVAADSGIVTLVDTDGIILGTTTATTLNATAGGAISDSGTLAVSGVSTLDDTSDTSIILDDAANNFGTVAADSGIVTLVDVDGIVLGAIDATTLNVTTDDAITQVGASAVSVSGTTTIVTTNDNVTLDEAGNDFSAVLVNAGTGTVTLRDTNAINLSTITADDLTVTATGGINDTAGPITVANILTLNGGAINLDEGNGLFGQINLTTTGAGNANISEASATEFVGTSNIGGTLTVTSTGAITDAAGADITVGGNATFNGASIALNEAATHDFGSITFDTTPGAVEIVEQGDMLIVGASDATTLTLTSGGAITDDATGAITTTGLATITGTSITLDSGLHNFNSVVLNSAGDVVLTQASDIILSGTSVVNSLTLNSTGGLIADDGTADYTVAGLADLTANGTITLDDTYDFGQLRFNTAAAVAIADGSATVLSGASTAGSLDLDSTGSITDLADTDLAITGLADFNGTSILIGDDAADTQNFGSLTVNSAGNVTVTEDSGLSFEGASVVGGDLVVSAEGVIDDDGAGADLAVTGLGSFTSTGGAQGITLDATDTHDFGTLAFNSATGAVVIDENSATVLSGTSTAASLNLDSNGTITDDGTADVVITGLADITNTGANAITLDDGNLDVGQLQVNSADAVTIVEENGFELAGATTATDLTLTATTGAITDDDASAAITASGLVTLSGDSIAVDRDNTHQFGTLTFTSNVGDVTIEEAGNMELAGASSSAGAATLIADGGSLTDGADGDLAVSGLATLTGDSITLGNDVGNDTNFGSLTFTSTGAVAIAEDSATELAGASTADSLDLDSTGAVTNGAGATVVVTNLADFDGTSITLNNPNHAFGSVTFNSAGSVVIFETSGGSVIAGSNTASDLVFVSGGAIIDSGGGDITTTGVATFTASTGGNIDLTNGTNAFNQLTFSSTGSVAITENDATDLTGTSVAGTLDLNSGGAITDTVNASLTVTGNADFADTGGAGITLGDTGTDTLSLGTLTFNSTGAVAISQDNDVTLAGDSTANSLALTSTGLIGHNDNTTLDVTGLAAFTAGGVNGITLGREATDTFDFGTLTFASGGAVSIAEDSATELAGTNTATSLDLDSTGAITDSAGVSLTVTGLADIANTGANAITLGDNGGDTVNFGSLTVNTVNNATITEDSGTEFAGASNVGGVLTVTASGNISDATDADIVVGGTASFTTVGLNAITLGEEANNVHTFGDLTFVSTGTVNITEDDTMDVNDGSDANALILLSRTGDINTAAGGLDIATNATLTAAGDVNILGDFTTRNPVGLVVFADSDTDGAGSFTVAAGVTIDTTPGTGDGVLFVTAEDAVIDPTATINVGTATVTLTENGGDGIGLGATASTNGMDISGAELQTITAANVELASQGLITVDGISAANSDNATLVTLDTGADVSIEGGVSTFNAIDVQADGGIDVDVNLITDTGDIVMDGDTNNADDTAPLDDAITFAGGVMLDSAGTIVLRAQTGGLIGLGTLDLEADAGLTLNSNLTTNGATLLDADDDGDGTGLLTVAGLTTVNSTNNVITVEAADIELDGTLNAGTSNVGITATNNRSLNIVDIDADTAGGAVMNLSAGDNSRAGNRQGELDRINAVNLTLNTTGAGDVRLNTSFATPGNDLATVSWQSSSMTLNDGLLTINAGNDFIMDPLERFTVVNTGTGGVPNGGSITVNSGNDITVADMTALTDVTLNANAGAGNVVVLRRPNGQTRFADGTVANDFGGDIVVGRAIEIFGATLTQGGSMTDPEFRLASQLSDTSVEFNNAAPPLVVGQPREVILTTAGGFTIDGAASGSSANVAAAIAAASPRVENAETVEELPLSQAATDRLAELNIFARDHSFDEIVNWLVGQRLYDDLPLSSSLSPAAREIAVGRLNPSLVSAVLEDYEALIFEPAVDEFGQPIFDDETGEAVERRVDGEIRATFAAAYSFYDEISSGPFDPVAFREYVRDNEPEAWANLLAVQQIIEGIELLALPPVESQTAIDSLIRTLTPENMDVDDLRNAASPPAEQVALLDQ
ncbi:filamentous hemagglutinin N-terminal domain-containing protein [Mucisphaera sp.]|uniref:filamentous hemagglutinin N-terminal domain-containing protein n=1 Tax=Mucisphaera sp. TaxID=2913024 RepID=UPI003D127CFD